MTESLRCNPKSPLQETSKDDFILIKYSEEQISKFGTLEFYS